MGGMIDDNNDYGRLWKDLKKYVDLNVDYLKVASTEKLTIILSSMAVIAVIMILGGIALFYISFSCVYLIKEWVGSEALAYLIVGAAMIVLLYVVYLMRVRLIVNPIARFLSKLFLNPNR